jgi:hypothetical protein
LLFEDADLVAEEVRVAPDVPFISVLGSEPVGDLFAIAADEDRGVGSLYWLRCQRGVGELVEFPIEVSSLVLEEGADHRDGLFEAAKAAAYGVEGDAVGLVLVLLPSRANAEDEAAAADVVDLRGHLGEDGGVAVSVAGDHGAEADARHGGGESGDTGPGFASGPTVVFLVRHEVVRDPEVVPAALLNVLSEVPEGLPLTGLVGSCAELHRDPRFVCGFAQD